MTPDVLVIDDEAVVRDGIALVLNAAGLSVATANDGAAALADPAWAHCRMALCDLMLPDCSGLEVLRVLRERRPDLPVVVMTGYIDAQSASEAIAFGAAGFLPKPFDESELLATVQNAIQAAAAARERRS